MLAALAGAAFALAAGTGSVAGGEQIYRQGISPRATPLQAAVGGGTVSAALLPCMNCHGADGRGRSEGGLRPADITPGALGRPLRDERRSRPAYDASRLRRAVTMGLDAAGAALDPAMPRYALSQADADDLLAFLAALDSRASAGVDEGRIRIALLGADAVAAPQEEIYGRRVELLRERRDDVALVIDVGADGAASLRAAAADAIPTIVFEAGAAAPGAAALVVTADPARRAQALRQWAERHAALIPQPGCADPGIAAASALALDAALAASCDVRTLPAAPARNLRLYLAAPPDPALRAAVARALLQRLRQSLGALGREVSRESLFEDLQRWRGVSLAGLPALDWTRGRRYGLDAVWVSRLDETRTRLLAEPGWVELAQ
nr:c-type cytochrome [Tahibacter harae]